MRFLTGQNKQNTFASIADSTALQYQVFWTQVVVQKAQPSLINLIPAPQKQSMSASIAVLTVLQFPALLMRAAVQKAQPKAIPRQDSF